MDYGGLIHEALRITWRNRFLWILGLFAPSGLGSIPSGGFPGGGSGGGGGRSVPETPFFPIEPGQPRLFEVSYSAPIQQPGPIGWLAQNPGLLLAGLGLLVLIFLAMVVVSLICQGGIAQATVDLARGRSSTFRSSWSAGRRLFWRYVGFWALLFLMTLVVIVLMAVLGVMGYVLISQTHAEAQGMLIAAGVLFLIPVVVIGIALLIAAGIVLMYAQRAIAAADMGPVRAIRLGYRLLRLNLATSLIVWLISLALGLAAGIALLIPVLIVTAILFGIGFAMYSASGFATGTIIYAVLAVLAEFAVLWGLAAVVNAFTWSYWSVAYVRLVEGGGSRPPATQNPSPMAA